MGRKRVDLEKRDRELPVKNCQQCLKQLRRKRFLSGLPESEDQFDRRKFCNKKCFSDWERGRPERATTAKLAANAMRCPICGITKDLSEFYSKGKNRSGTGRYGYCKPCSRIYQRELKLRHFFNITIDEYDKILAHQKGKCAICRRKAEDNQKRPSIDHNHTTGLVRGLLCWLCNRVVGLFNDDPGRFWSAVDYLTNPPATAALGSPRYMKREPKKWRKRSGSTLARDINAIRRKEKGRHQRGENIFDKSL